MKPHFPETREEVETMLHKGMGRAVLYLLSQDLSQYREMILDCCVHDYDYAPADHAGYLYPLIMASSEQDYYRDEMLKSLMTTHEDVDYGRFLDLAVLFARDGDERSREAIYEKLKRSLSDDRLPGAREAIDLDGVDGLTRVLGIIGPAAGDRQPIETELLIERAVRTSSAEAVSEAIRRSVSKDDNVAAALAAVELNTDSVAEDTAARLRKWRTGGRTTVSEGTTWEQVKSSPDFEKLVFQWSRVASDSEFARAAEDLDVGVDAQRIRAYLKLFISRPFPLGPEPLISLVDHPDNKVAISAACVLADISHPAVRELFDGLRGDEKWSDRAIGLLQSNYQSGDERIIEEMLGRETDPDKLHLLAMDTRQVYEKHPVPEGMQAMLLAYEKTPCSMCRYGCVEGIEALGPVPDWMIEECLHDVDSSTRELAARLKSGSA